MQTLVKNGYLIDPASDREGFFDLIIDDDRIKRVDKNIDAELLKAEAAADGKELRIIDARGRYVMPGFIDLHVHLREPGFEYKETITSGCMAAAAGGFTSICAMPNTKPTADRPDVIRLVRDKAEQACLVNVLPVAAITINQEGKEPVNIKELIEAGACALSEDGKSVMDSAVYIRAMIEAARYDIPIFAHCEDKSLAGDGAINAGKKAEELGLAGISNAVEDVIVARDILLAKQTGVRLHICHCSTKDSVKIISLAKEAGIQVTAEVCPHHFTLSDEDIPADDANYKMNPPLRSREDVKALCDALKNNIIDVIATDHAPHDKESKDCEFERAANGMVGFETALAVGITYLVKTGKMTLSDLIYKMTAKPAEILKLNKGRLKEGMAADIVIYSPDIKWVVEKEKLLSKSKNTPFDKAELYGKVLYTICGGKIIVSQGQLI